MTSLRTQQILSDVLDGPIESALDRLCAACVAAVPVRGVALALTAAGLASTLVATDSQAEHGQGLQRSLGEGPGVDALASGRPVLESDVTAVGARWPAFAAAAAEEGIVAVFAFPLQVGAIRLGVLDLYNSVPGTLDALQLREALAFADAARTIVLSMQDQTTSDGPDGMAYQSFAETIDGDREIHQATGMVAVQAAIALADALVLLRARAFADERSLLALSKDVVARRIRFSPDGHDE